MIDCDQSTIVRYLRSWVKLKDWMPHVSSENNKNRRFNIWASLLTHYRLSSQQHRPFLSPIVTGDETFCFYVNIKNRKQWVSSNRKASPPDKVGIHPRQLMLCIWWYYELLSRNYC